MNKKRLLKLLEILKRNSDGGHHLSLNEIIALLEKEDIEINNRKTLYDDFKILSQMGFDIEYDKGYYLLEAPFSLAEIKIILDSLSSLKNLDDKLLNQLTNKLYSFISIDEEKLLEKLFFNTKHKDSLLLQKIQLLLETIDQHFAIELKRNNKKPEIIYPLFIHRQNDYYYLYYHYQNNNKIYHFRFDNFKEIKIIETKDEITIPLKEVKEYIKASSNAFYKAKTTTVNLLGDVSDEYLKQRISDDFNDVLFTKEGFSIKVSINEVFFSKLVAYGTKLRIKEKDIGQEYANYLKQISTIYYLPEK